MTSLLPTHPSKRHPLTGEPLRALWVRPDGRICWPIMGGAEGDDPEPEPGSDPEPEPTDDLSKAKGETKKWRGRAESNYEILRKLGINKPEDADGVLERLQRQEALEDELASDKDKAVKEAKSTTQAEADATYQPKLVKTAFRIAIGDRKKAEEVDDFLADLNLSRFLTADGDVDTAKVFARVDEFAPTGEQATRRKAPVVTSPPKGGKGTGELSSLSGSELFDRLHPKKTAS